MTRTKEIVIETTILIAVAVALMVGMQKDWMYMLGAVLIVFVLFISYCNYSDARDEIERHDAIVSVQKHFPNMGINEAQRVARYVLAYDRELDKFKAALDQVEIKFPDLCIEHKYFLALEVCWGKNLDSMHSADSTIKTIIKGEEKFLTSDGYWRSVGLRDPNKTAYQKELDEIKSRYPLLTISDNNLKRISSLMYFNWELLYIAKDEDEYSVQLRRRDESMNWTFTEPTKKH